MVCQSAPPASAPLPRLTARSMLSLGTEVFLAFWIASNSVGLPAGSPPPVRAATSMFLISLAKSLPRLASIAAFLCLVVAHLECPLMMLRFLCSQVQDPGDPTESAAAGSAAGRAHHGREALVHAPVTRHLGVEGRREQVALADRDHLACRRSGLHRAEDVDAGTGLLHPRGTDEDRPEQLLARERAGLLRDGGHVQVLLEGVHLTAEGVAPHRDVQAAEGLLVGTGVGDAVGQHDHPRTRSVGGHAVGEPLAQRLLQVEGEHQLFHRRRLPTGAHKRLYVVALAWATDAGGVGAEALEHPQVLADVALDGQDADADGVFTHSPSLGRATG